MRPKTLLILLVVVLGLGSFIWFYERKLPSSRSAGARKAGPPGRRESDVTAVTLQSSKGTVRFERVARRLKRTKRTTRTQRTRQRVGRWKRRRSLSPSGGS